MSEKACALSALELVLATREARLSLREFKSVKNAVLARGTSLNDLNNKKTRIEAELERIHETCAERSVLLADLKDLSDTIKNFGDQKKLPQPTVSDLEKVRLELDAKLVTVQAKLSALGKCGLSTAKIINRGQRTRGTLETVVKNIKIGGVARDSMAAPYTGRDVMTFLNRTIKDIVKETLPDKPPTGPVSPGMPPVTVTKIPDTKLDEKPVTPEKLAVPKKPAKPKKPSPKKAKPPA
ncbi:MAG: hypothetical protein Q8P23_02885 [bacterium]|nr:hypothetical protein [bacterium]